MCEAACSEMINSVRIFSYQDLLEMIYSLKYVIFINFSSNVALEAVDFILGITKLLPSGKKVGKESVRM